ncbi:MAG TPA: hypothetical protein DCR93_21555, partial [Cytophagales bacterium]|nr:hypothetical protein [Cytophagales bacterium]
MWHFTNCVYLPTQDTTNPICMKKSVYLLLGCLTSLFTFQCSPSTSTAEEEVPPQDEVVLSFAFLGCNRVSYGDRNNDSATNITTANLAQLKRIFEELSAMERKPELFFFLGDLVEGEKFDVTLERQLPAWFAQYNDPGFSPISQSGIELVAVPGNHEMLYYDSVGENAGDEFPLAG